MASLTLWAMLSLLSLCHAQSADELLLGEIQKLTEAISNQKMELLSNFEEIKEDIKEEIGDMIREANADWQTMVNETQNDVTTLQHLLDVDECSNGRHNCSADASCTDTRVSFRCQCKPGFTGDGYTCEDVDECKNKYRCGAFAKCTNSPGAYSCSCRPGFRGDGSTCEDVDECSEGTHKCHKYAVCTNTRGSYSCKCSVFHRGNGRICHESGGAGCKEPFKYISGVGCIHAISRRKSFDQSRENCKELGGDLFVAMDADHYLRLTQHFIDTNQAAKERYMWVGVKEGSWLSGRIIDTREEVPGMSKMRARRCGYTDGDRGDNFRLWNGYCSDSFGSVCQITR